MNRRYRVTPRALNDLKNIGRYSFQTWGKAQRDKYLRAIDRRFAWLAENPHLGTHRPDIADGYHCFPQGSHLAKCGHRSPRNAPRALPSGQPGERMIRRARTAWRSPARWC
ncbi:MAG: type II toxin-antitoxin system RelE/ParE family toxin [Alphaproteobacteria bacterium]